MNLLFFVVFGTYFLAVIAQFSATAFKKEKLARIAWWLFLAAFALHSQIGRASCRERV